MKHRGKTADLPEEVVNAVNYYASKVGKGFNEALADLVSKGLRYYELEVMYGSDLRRREVWDRRFYFLKVDAGTSTTGLGLRKSLTK